MEYIILSVGVILIAGIMWLLIELPEIIGYFAKCGRCGKRKIKKQNACTVFIGVSDSAWCIDCQKNGHYKPY